MIRRRTTHRRSVLVFAVFALVLSACDAWPALGHDASRSSHNPSETTLAVDNVASLSETWSADVPATGTGSSPVVAGGSVFVASGQLQVFSANGSTGCAGTPRVCEPLWTANQGGSESPAVAGRVVYTTWNGSLYAFDARGETSCSGVPKVCRPLWRAGIGGSLGSPAVANGVVYVGTDREPGFDRLYAFDAAGSTGCSGTPRLCQPLWTSAGHAGRTPAVDGGFVYTVTNVSSEGELEVTLSAFDAAGQIGCSGTPKRCAPRWHFEAPAVCSGGCGFEEPPSVAAGRVWVVYSSCCGGGQSYSNLGAFDADGVDGCSGTPTVCQPVETAPVARTVAAPHAPVAFANGTAYVSDVSLKAFAEPGLAVRWGSSTAAISSPSIANGVVYALTIDVQSKVRAAAFDAAGQQGCSGSPTTCAPLWSGPAVDSDVSAIFQPWSPPVVAAGTLFVRLGRLRAYRLPPG